MAAQWVYGPRNRPFRCTLWKVCVLSGIMAAFITNDATVLVLTPLLLTECIRQGRCRKEILPLALGIATSANIGSTSTAFGNLQNMIISSATDLVLKDFFIAALPAAILGLTTGISLLYIAFYGTLFTHHSHEEMEDCEANRQRSGNLPVGRVARSIPEERQCTTMKRDQSTDPHLSSQIADERERMFMGQSRLTPSGSRYSLAAVHTTQHSAASPRYVDTGVHSSASSGVTLREVSLPEIRVTHEEEAEDGREVFEVVQRSKVVVIVERLMEESLINLKPLKERSCQELVFIAWLLFVLGLTVLLLTIPPPPKRATWFNLGLVPLGASIFTMLIDSILNKKYAFEVMARVDWASLLMLMGLFCWLKGFQNTCIPHYIFKQLAPHMDLYTFGGVMFFSTLAFVGTNILSVVPLTILLVDKVPELCGEEQCPRPLGGLLLAWVTSISSNALLVSSTTNLITAEKTQSTANYKISFLHHARFGLASGLLVIYTGLPLVYLLARYAT